MKAKQPICMEKRTARMGALLCRFSGKKRAASEKIGGIVEIAPENFGVKRKTPGEGKGAARQEIVSLYKTGG